MKIFTSSFFSGKIFSGRIRAGYKQAYTLIAAFVFMHGTSFAQEFQCAPYVYQVTAPSGGQLSTLYSYNINTGTATKVAALGVPVNAAGYSTIDSLIWGWDQVHNKLVSIDATGTVTSHTIPNLPGDSYNVGDIINGSYLLLTQTGFTNYYVVDINPAHTGRYLKLVNPANNFALDGGPTYGTNMHGGPLNANDMAYNPIDGVFYGLGTPGTANADKIVRFNPLNGNVSTLGKVTTGGIGGETDGFGSTFFDAAGTFYVFANNQGTFYRIDMSTLNAVPLSTTMSANNNDGAGCTLEVLSYEITGNVFDDGNGLNDNTVNGIGTNAGGINAVLFDNTTGMVSAITAVNSDGTFGLAATPGHSYTVYITSGSDSIGQTNIPGVTLPASWVITGEKFGAGVGSDGTPDGILTIGTVNSDTSFVDFGIEQIPQATTQAYIIPVPLVGSSITLNSPDTSAPRPLSGTDLEDGNYGSGSTFIINSLDSMKGNILLYNGTPVTAVDTIRNFDSSLLQIQFTENLSGNISFTYSTIDSVSQVSLPATYTINWTPLLPVILANINGVVTNNGATIIWTTAEETNTSQFIIQSSTDGRNFSNEGLVSAKGNSNSQQTYSYTDNNSLVNTGTIYYRLKVVDIDGQFTYSNVVAVTLSDKQTKAAISLYPNPANNQILVSVPVSIGKYFQYKIYSSNGSLIKSGNMNSQTELLDIKDIPAGTYMIKVANENGNFVKRFIKMN